MKERERHYQFLISPDPATETNQTLSRYLWQRGLITESQEMDCILVGGKKVYGWIVDYFVITQLEKHIRAYPKGAFKAAYYEKEGDGEWRPCKLPYLQRKAAKLKQTSAHLEEIKKGGREKKHPRGRKFRAYRSLASQPGTFSFGGIINM